MKRWDDGGSSFHDKNRLEQSQGTLRAGLNKPINDGEKPLIFPETKSTDFREQRRSVLFIVEGK